MGAENQEEVENLMSKIGIALVIIGCLILFWGSYAYYWDIGFQRDVPQFLTFPFVEVYGAATAVIGWVIFYSSRRKSHVQQS